jgi:iron complex transport system ATP-binding protein
MALEIEGLGVSVRGRRLLEAVDFSAEPGRFSAVIGPNGAGKSTLLRAIAQMMPHKGEVRLGGRSLRGLERRELARRVAYLPQFGEVPPLTVLERLELGRRAYAGAFLQPRDRAVLDDLIERFDLGEALSRPLEHLSGGERQKVMIAATLAQEPQLLLLDEPTSHLDPRNQMEVLRTVAGVSAAQNIATLVVLHDVQQALHFADETLMLRGGRLVEQCACTGVSGAMLERLYDTPVKLFWQEGHPFLFFGHHHDDAAAHIHHHRSET